MDIISKKIPVLMAITAALTLSCIIIAFVAVQEVTSPPENSPPQELLTILPVLAIVLIVIGFGVKSFLIKRLFPNQVAKGDLEKFFNTYLVTHMISLALRETGVIVGFVLTLMTGETLWVIGSAAIVVVINLLDFPTKKKLQGHILNS